MSELKTKKTRITPTAVVRCQEGLSDEEMNRIHLICGHCEMKWRWDQLEWHKCITPPPTWRRMRVVLDPRPVTELENLTGSLKIKDDETL